MQLRPICRAGLVVALSACASAPAVDPPPRADDAATTAIAAAITTRWTGDFQPTQSRTGEMAPTERQRAYGTIELIVPRDRPDRTHVRLTVSTRATLAISTLRWGIYPGTCGSGAPPVVPAEAFPSIELGNSGRGSIDQEIAFEMPKEGRYHVNVLQGTGTQLSNVLTCANLRRAT
jgi:hypothetical protein